MGKYSQSLECDNCGSNYYLNLDEGMEDTRFCSDKCADEYWDLHDDRNNGPTGHGDICHSDADPGL